MLGTIKTSTTPALTPTKTCTAQACEQAAKKKEKEFRLGPRSKKREAKKKVSPTTKSYVMPLSIDNGPHKEERKMIACSVP